MFLALKTVLFYSIKSEEQNFINCTWKVQNTGLEPNLSATNFCCWAEMLQPLWWQKAQRGSGSIWSWGGCPHCPGGAFVVVMGPAAGLSLSATFLAFFPQQLSWNYLCPCCQRGEEEVCVGAHQTWRWIFPLVASADMPAATLQVLVWCCP